MLISNILENKANILNFTSLVISVWATSPPCFQLLWNQTSQFWSLEPYNKHLQLLSSDMLAFYELSLHTDPMQTGPRFKGHLDIGKRTQWKKKKVSSNEEHWLFPVLSSPFYAFLHSLKHPFYGQMGLVTVLQFLQ